jgi:large subunit ribosomal protein L13
MKQWYVVDATDQALGRMASRIALILRGKHKPSYQPHCDHGDYVIVINADRIRVTGRKRHQKMYYKHSGYPGGLKAVTFENLQKKAPACIVEKAIHGMMPRGPLGRDMCRKLKVYASSVHPHVAQQAVLVNLETI